MTRLIKKLLISLLIAIALTAGSAFIPRAWDNSPCVVSDCDSAQLYGLPFASYETGTVLVASCVGYNGIEESAKVSGPCDTVSSIRWPEMMFNFASYYALVLVILMVIGLRKKRLLTSVS